MEQEGTQINPAAKAPGWHCSSVGPFHWPWSIHARPPPLAQAAWQNSLLLVCRAETAEGRQMIRLTCKGLSSSHESVPIAPLTAWGWSLLAECGNKPAWIPDTVMDRRQGISPLMPRRFFLWLAGSAMARCQAVPRPQR